MSASMTNLLGGALNQAVSTVSSDVSAFTSGSTSRLTQLKTLLANGSTAGSINSNGTGTGQASTSTSGAANSVAMTANGSTTNDLRIRVSPVNIAFYGADISTSILAPLKATNGVQFPFSPQIGFEQTVDYTPVNMVHTNTDFLAYQRTPSVSVSITGKFTCQNQVEGLYALAAIHFFRTASKMYFGVKAGTNAGLPPPVLKLNGYGDYMFKDLTCILKSHSFAFNEAMDTVPIASQGGTVRLPAMFDLTISLQIQVTPKKMRDEFDLDAFRTGALMRNGGWI